MDIKEATQKWVNGFNAIPQELIVRAYQDSYFEDLVEITPLAVGDSVEFSEGSGYGEIIRIDNESETVIVRDGKDYETSFELSLYDVHPLYQEEFLPMWGTMWTFGESLDEWWLEEQDGLQKMAECGFRIYECDELGYVFGIDGAGYSFFDEHWIPLYKARGLQWHINNN